MTEVNTVETENKNIPEQNVAQEPQQNLEKTEVKETHEDPNWRAFREARKKDRAEMEEAKRRAAEKEAEIAALKAAMEAAFSKNSPTPQAYQQYYGMNQEPEESEEQKLERKFNEFMQKKEQERMMIEQQREMQEYPQKLRRDYPDFASVCSQDNLDYLDYHYPEIARPLQRLQEGYDKWSDIYHAVKKLIPNVTNAKKDMQKAEMNSLKPKSPNIMPNNPTGQNAPQSWQEVEQRRAQNWARMQKIMNGI